MTNKFLYSPEFQTAINEEADHIHPHADKTTPSFKAYKKNLKATLTERIELIDEATAYHLPQPTTVYNGFNVVIPKGKDTLAYIKNMHTIGSLYSRPSYMSTSTNPAVAAAFTEEEGNTGTPVVYEILTNHGAPLRELAPLSTEDEILLQRNKQFRIVQVKESVTFNEAWLSENDTVTLSGNQTKIIVIQLIEEVSPYPITPPIPSTSTKQ